MLFKRVGPLLSINDQTIISLRGKSMSIENELKKILEDRGFKQKTKGGLPFTKNGSIWTYNHPKYKVVNYHNNGTICFNYIKKYMENIAREMQGTKKELSVKDNEYLYTKSISTLPFHERIKNHISLGKNGYMVISEKVGINILGEIVQFIITDAGAENLSVQAEAETGNLDNYLPTKKDVESAAKYIPLGVKGNIFDLLDKVEKNALAEGKDLHPDWQDDLEEKIAIWFN